MQILRHYDDVPAPLRGAVVALGNFDGVHRGHQALIGQAQQMARSSSAPVGVVAFEPHPQEFFKPNEAAFRLTPFRIKARLIAELGADVLFALAFDAAMAQMTAEEFVRTVLVQGLGVRGVVVGRDFRFGKGRAGDGAMLAALGKAHGFAVHLHAPVAAGTSGVKISSTLIRETLKAGRPEEAARLLGHWWTIESHVEHGDKRGRVIGFPTINMRWEGSLAPAYGVYAVRARDLDGGDRGPRYDGVANFGIRPMYALPQPLLETYLLDFDGDLYGRHMSVELIAYLRPEAKFDSLEALKAQIDRDLAAARQALRQSGLVPPPLDH